MASSVNVLREAFGLAPSDALLGEYYCQYTLLPEQWVTGKMFLFQSCVCLQGETDKKLVYKDMRHVRLRKDSMLQVLNPAYTVQVLVGTDVTQVSWLFAEDAFFEILCFWTLARWRAFIFQVSVVSRRTRKGVVFLGFVFPLTLFRLLMKTIVFVILVLKKVIVFWVSRLKKLKRVPKSPLPTEEEIEVAAEGLENVLVKVKEASEHASPDLVAPLVGHCTKRVEKVNVAARLLAGSFLNDYVAGRVGALKQEPEQACTRTERGDQTEVPNQNTQDIQTSDELDVFQTETQVLRKELYERKKELVQAKRTVIEQNLKIQEQQTQLEKDVHQNYSLEFQVEKHKTEAEMAQQQLDTAKEKVAEMEGKLVEMGTNVVELERTIREKDESLRESRQRKTEQERAQEKDSELISELRATNVNLNQQLQAVQRDLYEEKQ
eukprot:gene14324-16938_t